VCVCVRTYVRTFAREVTPPVTFGLTTYSVCMGRIDPSVKQLPDNGLTENFV